jgi:site-specific DNA-methyltransferase (adenine-specific)
MSIEMSLFIQGDTLTTLRTQMKNKSIDLIYCDPPFGTTKNNWDEKQDWPAIFKECFRILKDNGMLVIHCSIPFNYELIRASPKAPSHTWYWKKENITNALICKYQPMRNTEEILVWKNKKFSYFPQRVGNELRTFQTGKPSRYYGSSVEQEVKTVVGKYRTHFLDMKRDISGFSTRPKELVKLMIDSYSQNTSETVVLDLYCYNGLSHTCKGNRRWIGIDKHFIPSMVVSAKHNTPIIHL